MKSRVNEAGVYTKPTLRKKLFERIKAGDKGGAPGQWSARKANFLLFSIRKKVVVIKNEKINYSAKI